MRTVRHGSGFERLGRWIAVAVFAGLTVLCLLLGGCQSPPAASIARDAAGALGVQMAEHPAAAIAIRADGSTTITPPTAADEALGSWVRYGAIVAICGLVLCLGVFGGNVRTGLTVAIGGVAMAATGRALGSMTLEIPVWLLPSVLILAAAGMIYGYSVRETQLSKDLRTMK